MPQVNIKYNNSRTLRALKDFAKYFDFIISAPKSTENSELKINGVSIIPADNSIDISEMNKIFTGKNMNAGEIRIAAWQRKK